jgi:amino-acid racemase
VQPGLIGILAGMGPRSTAPFVDMVVDECQRQYGARYDDEFPPMMIYSLPTPFYIDRPIDHAALRAAISAGLQRLASTGVAFIAMPCNTAHIYYADLAASAQIPLLNMVDEVLRAIPPSTGRVALLATRPTAESGIYQAAIERAGVGLAAPAHYQGKVDRLIALIKAAGDSSPAQAIWRDLLAELAADRVDVALLACTDLNVVSEGVSGAIPIFDATRCLAAAVVREWRKRS